MLFIYLPFNYTVSFVFSGIEWKALWDQDAPPFSPVLKNLDVEEDPSWMMKSLVLGNPQALN